MAEPVPLRRYVMANAVALVPSYGHNDAVPNSHALFVGTPGNRGAPEALEAINHADVILALGSRLNQHTTHWNDSVLDRHTRIVQVDIDAHEVGRNHPVEVGIESTRNERVSAIVREVDDFVLKGFEGLFQRMKDAGRIAPDLDIPMLTQTFLVIAAGLFWRRALDPAFDGNKLVPAVLQVIGLLLKPVTEQKPEPTRAANKQDGDAP